MQISLAQTLGFIAVISSVAARVPKHKDDGSSSAVYSGTPTGVYSSSSTGKDAKTTVTSALSSPLTRTTTTVVVSTSTTAVSALSSPQGTTTTISATTTTTSSATTTTTISATTTTTSSATTTTPVDCATPIVNSGFEYTTMVQWKRQYPNPETPYDFKVTSNVTAPHTGNQSASIMYTKGAIGYETWFNQFISFCPNTLYNFRSYTKVSTEGTGCSVSYAIGDRNGTVLAGLVGHSSQDLTTEWLGGSATYRSGTGVDAVKAAIDIRVSCYETATEDRAWYFDDVSLVAAKHT